MSQITNRREFMQTAGVALGAVAAAAGAATAAAGSPPQASAPPATMGARFRRMLERRETFPVMGVYDVMTARLAEVFEFPALFIGSSAVAEFHGVPDWGLFTLRDTAEYAGRIAQSVEAPSLLDIDDDGHTPLVLYQAVKQFEQAGIGALHIVDRRVSWGQNGGFFTRDEMVDRIKAAVDARSDMVITARCQTAGAEGLEAALERASAYAAAGAESIWFTGIGFEDLPRAARAVGAPLTAQLGSEQPISEAQAAQVTVAVYASLVQNIAQSAVYKALVELRETGRMVESAGGVRLGNTMPADVTARIRGVDAWRERAERIGMRF